MTDMAEFTDLRFSSDQVVIKPFNTDMSHIVHMQCGGYRRPRPRQKAGCTASVGRARPYMSGGLHSGRPCWQWFSGKQLLTALETINVKHAA